MIQKEFDRKALKVIDISKEQVYFISLVRHPKLMYKIKKVKNTNMI